METLAKNYLKMGKFKKYCEILVRSGKWEKALAFAPAVSYEYWYDAAHKYAAFKKDEDYQQSVFYYLATSDIEKVKYKHPKKSD